MSARRFGFRSPGTGVPQVGGAATQGRGTPAQGSPGGEGAGPAHAASAASNTDVNEEQLHLIDRVATGHATPLEAISFALQINNNRGCMLVGAPLPSAGPAEGTNSSASNLPTQSRPQPRLQSQTAKRAHEQEEAMCGALTKRSE
jgi:hypothetical protein